MNKIMTKKHFKWTMSFSDKRYGTISVLDLFDDPRTSVVIYHTFGRNVDDMIICNGYILPYVPVFCRNGVALHVQYVPW